MRNDCQHVVAFVEVEGDLHNRQLVHPRKVVLVNQRYPVIR